MWKLALLLAALALAALILPVCSLRARKHRSAFVMLAGLLMLAALVVGRQAGSPPQGLSSLEDFRPVEMAGKADDPYASSSSCVECHQQQYNSWHASWHRTMTQVAQPTTVLGDFDNVQTQAYGKGISLSREDDQFWVTMHDPNQEAANDSTIIRRPIVMTTGSHHMQVYWYATGKDRRVAQLPIVWLKETSSWVPIHSIFLRPTQHHAGKSEGRWNNTCIKCHATQGRPRIVPNDVPPVDTHVAEFGIACEACHGPAAEHVAHHRATDTPTEGSSSRLVNPADLPHERSAEVCGQCHGVWMARDKEEADHMFVDGLRYRPGDELSKTRHVFMSEQQPSQHVTDYLASDPDFLSDRFWGDGMVRVSGREYNGLIRSPCFQNGDMTCLTCHALHPDEPYDAATWADDQLTHKPESNDACLQCHQQLSVETALVEHTHHAADSSGSLCYNCHMPHTTYGLLKAIRSHEISSPSIRETVEFGRPNACNQCHLDKTLAWTGDWLQRWYSQTPPPNLSADQQTYSDRLLAALSGDAGERALAAWAMGWEPARQASNTDWLEPILGQLMKDPYHAVRFLAHRSLQAQQNQAPNPFDFTGTEADLARQADAMLQGWQQTATQRRENRAVLISSDGSLMLREFRRLLEGRNDRVVVLAE